MIPEREGGKIVLKSHGRLKAQKRHMGQNSPAQLAGLFGKWLNLNKDFGAPKRLRLFTPSWFLQGSLARISGMARRRRKENCIGQNGRIL
jgi:hypothetical protein